MDLQPLKIERKEPARAVRRRGSRWVAPVVLLALLGAVGWLFHAPIRGFVDGLRLPEVTVHVVHKSSPATGAASGTSSNGYVVAKTRAALSADTPGRIVQLNVQEGSVVRKGDVVARLYSDEYAALLRRAEADLVLAKTGLDRSRAERKVAEADLDRLRSSQTTVQAEIAALEPAYALAQLELQRSKKLLDDGIDTAERLDRAKTSADAARAQVEAARARLATAADATSLAESQLAVSQVAEKEADARIAVAVAMRDQAQATLDKTEVRAPFDGIVVLKDAEVGEVVSPNVQGGSNARGSVVTMVDFASLEVQAEWQETSLGSVRVGGPARIYLDAYPDKSYPGRVDRIWPTANRSKATVEVRVTFLERDERLRPEMGARVVLLDEKAAPNANTSAPQEPVLMISTSAVVKSRGTDGATGSSVFLVERDTVHLQDVRLGGERSGRVVVESGLTDGDVVVLDPPSSLSNGDRVRIRN